MGILLGPAFFAATLVLLLGLRWWSRARGASPGEAVPPEAVAVTLGPISAMPAAEAPTPRASRPRSHAILVVCGTTAAVLVVLVAVFAVVRPPGSTNHAMQGTPSIVEPDISVVPPPARNDSVPLDVPGAAAGQFLIVWVLIAVGGGALLVFILRSSARPSVPGTGQQLPGLGGVSFQDGMTALISLVVLLGALALIFGDSSQDNQKWAYGMIGSIVGHWVKPSGAPAARSASRRTRHTTPPIPSPREP